MNAVSALEKAELAASGKSNVSKNGDSQPIRFRPSAFF